MGHSEISFKRIKTVLMENDPLVLGSIFRRLDREGFFVRETSYGDDVSSVSWG